MIEGTVYRNERSENPNTDAIFDACKKCYASPPSTVRLWVKLPSGKGVGLQIEVSVRGVDHESGTPGMLLLAGYLKNPIDGHTEYSAFYDARDGHGTGHITLLRVGEKKS
jgi:hypothetical protein